MTHSLPARSSPRSAMLRLCLFQRSSKPQKSDRSTARRVFLLLALTLGLGTGSFAERGLAADPTARGQVAPFHLAQAVPAGDGVLQLNDSGDAVADLQRQLTRLGFFSDEITGFFGTATQAAVSQFQQANGLTPDGIAGAATQAALGQGSSASEATSSAPRDFLQLNDSGDQVAELQRRLTALGYYSGSASGVFDGATQFAVISFQQANGLTADGVVGAETTAALRRAGGQGSFSAGSTPAGSAPAAPTSPAPAAIGSSVAPEGSLLRVGSNGAAVSTLQTQLQSLGFYVGTISGVFDAQTEAAVTAFQRSRGLVADGIAGPQVNATLSSATGTNPSAATQPNSPAQVQYIQQMQQAQIAAEQARREAEQARLEAEKARLVYQQNLQEGRYSTVELQRRLQSNGYNPGDLSGVMTPTTEGAIADAQRSYGLSESDFLGTGGMPLF
ncbi:peptidoglycan-binding protein [Leptolyngbya sp. FACHB-711]|uniref:peptidoglycan-binding domain-containing protein n=1 Tax=unclassified Leptolyngbya TaxID=2650499 RepID=UPI001689DE98|nr:peptidoglycan-binding protein [Leptolyngbya sp. FACHB-711]MBD1848753.1 peptidoglycan-binding protein [Cyanobacteria bacterium FACHB-502]MBD2023315.1 peptidoglycan-binding protein [Leptolyngbya sp. FACHB-711]